jgi:hypothetical protein
MISAGCRRPRVFWARPVLTLVAKAQTRRKTTWSNAFECLRAMILRKMLCVVLSCVCVSLSNTR